jgi:hypothetical protein
MRICCVPSRQQHAYELQRKIWVYKMSSNLNVLTQFYCTLQLYAHTELLNDIDNAQLLYHVTVQCLSPIEKKKFSEEDDRQAHYVPNIAHLKLLLSSDENPFSRNSLNVVSLEVPSTCPPNCAHVILIRSAESPV